MPKFPPAPSLQERVHAAKARRRSLLEAMAAQGGGVALVPTAPEVRRNRDTPYPYRADSDFLHLSAFDEPESFILLSAGAEFEEILFCRPKDPERETWDGFLHGPEAAAAAFGFDKAYPIGELDARAAEILGRSERLFYAVGARPEWDARFASWTDALRKASRAGKSAPFQIVDLRSLTDPARLVKDDVELASLRRAGAIASAAHFQAMAACRPGMFEYELEAVLLAAFRSAGASGPSFPSIVAGGSGACTLHYVANDRRLSDGSLVLIDAGCEVDGYASDISRTFPVSGRFSGPQRDLHDLVFEAQAAAIARIAPGARFDEPHDAAVRILVQGLVDLRILPKVGIDDAVEAGLHKPFYMHRTSHWLGLDVHDVGAVLEPDGSSKILAPGMVLTVEPGLYLRDDPSIPKAFRGIGIRIEDDILVTDSGRESLTSGAKGSTVIETLLPDRRLPQ